MLDQMGGAGGGGLHVLLSVFNFHSTLQVEVGGGHPNPVLHGTHLHRRQGNRVQVTVMNTHTSHGNVRPLPTCAPEVSPCTPCPLEIRCQRVDGPVEDDEGANNLNREDAGVQTFHPQDTGPHSLQRTVRTP